MANSIPSYIFDWVPNNSVNPANFPFKLKASSPTLPSRVDLRQYDSPILDQGAIGSSVANALAGAYNFLEMMQLRSSADLTVAPEVFVQGQFVSASRLYIDRNMKFLQGPKAKGADLYSGIQALVNYGCCSETDWPYVQENVGLVPPNDPCYAYGVKHRISVYESLQSLDDMRLCLIHGFPFVFGMLVYPSFTSAQVASNGHVPMPSASELAASPLGGYAAMCVGFDDTKQYLICRSSLGTGWGISGYFTLPYAYAQNESLANSFWMIKQ